MWNRLNTLTDNFRMGIAKRILRLNLGTHPSIVATQLRVVGWMADIDE